MSTKTLSTNLNPLMPRRKVTILATAIATALAASQTLSPAFAAMPPTSTNMETAAASSPLTSFASVIEAVKPAVVNISATTVGADKVMRGPTPNPRSDLPFPELFRRFFEHQFPDGWHRRLPREALAQGSGFIIDATGYIVTNNHVVANAEEITVTLNDGTQYPAELKGRDKKTDLALLKVEAEQPLPYVSFGNSDAARTGDWVIAIGNPFGLGGTATAGIISARGRDIQSGPFDDFIQIDAPINRGNSGGPLFDKSGQVIGVNTAIFSPNGGNVGIGFAIPSSLVQSVIQSLRDQGYVARGWLGVQIQRLSPDLAESLDLEKTEGALVASVVADSPAAKAGIEVGDVITGFDGQKIKQLKDLTRLVAATKAKEKVEVKLWRDGSNQTIDVVVGQMSETETLAANTSKQDMAGKGRLGLALAELTPEARDQNQLPEDTNGVLIVGVRENSPAADKGLRTGDVILMVGQREVSSSDEVVREIAQATEAKRETVLLLVGRGGARQFVVLDLA